MKGGVVEGGEILGRGRKGARERGNEGERDGCTEKEGGLSRRMREGGGKKR